MWSRTAPWLLLPYLSFFADRTTILVDLDTTSFFPPDVYFLRFDLKKYGFAALHHGYYFPILVFMLTEQQYLDTMQSLCFMNDIPSVVGQPMNRMRGMKKRRRLRFTRHHPKSRNRPTQCN